jgi:hypothetical protein
VVLVFAIDSRKASLPGDLGDADPVLLVCREPRRSSQPRA